MQNNAVTFNQRELMSEELRRTSYRSTTVKPERAVSSSRERKGKKGLR
jgi:hypothetical protein